MFSAVYLGLRAPHLRVIHSFTLFDLYNVPIIAYVLRIFLRYFIFCSTHLITMPAPSLSVLAGKECLKNYKGTRHSSDCSLFHRRKSSLIYCLFNSELRTLNTTNHAIQNSNHAACRCRRGSISSSTGHTSQGRGSKETGEDKSIM
jgi:hypothetical protein